MVSLIFLIYQQRFLFNAFNAFYFFIKKAFLTFLFLGSTFFFTSMGESRSFAITLTS